jgi:glutaredoxin
MSRLVVYGSSVPCPDMARFSWWLDRHEVSDMVMLDIHRDPEAYDKVIAWTGHASVPTLVIADDDGFEPVVAPTPLGGRSARAFDRGTVLTEPNPGQIVDFLVRNGIPVVEKGKEPPAGQAIKTPTGAAESGSAPDVEGPHKTVVTVYPITGKQLFFHVPHSWCRECNLTIRAVQSIIEGHREIELRVKPWWNNLFDALRRGGWHAPVVTINGKVFSQGIVPDPDALRGALGIAAS